MASDGIKRNYVRSGKLKKGYDYALTDEHYLFTNNILNENDKILDKGPSRYPAVTLSEDGKVIYFPIQGKTVKIKIDKESFERLNYTYDYISNRKIGTIDRWMLGHNEIVGSNVDFYAEDWGEYKQDTDGNDCFNAVVSSSNNEIRVFVNQEFTPDGPYVPEAHDGETLPYRTIHLEWKVYPKTEDGQLIEGINAYAVSEIYSPATTIQGQFYYICLISDWSIDVDTVVLHFDYEEIKPTQE